MIAPLTQLPPKTRQSRPWWRQTGLRVIAFRLSLFRQPSLEIAAWKAWLFLAWLGLAAGYYWGHMLQLW